jgi:DNA helicase-2/ATP-dependent DNA helicase PcrA
MFRHLGKDIFAEDELDLIWEETRRALDDKRLEPEDIPPIMLLQLKLLLSKDGLDTRHIVIDEAQDYSLFQFSILKDIVKSQSFSILGDVNQGIYSYHGIENWEDLEENIFDHRPQMFSMEQSYRTTVEIMDCANSVIARLGKRGVPLAKPVIRHGEAVSVYVLADMATIAAAIDEDIKRIVADGFHSIAIICKTEAECHEFGQMLNSHPVMITGGETEYPGGLLLLPSYLTKGLEFDAVIIANATPGNYTADPLDIKLLYIAMTRALHRLKIYAVNEVTKLIRNVNVQEN